MTSKKFKGRVNKLKPGKNNINIATHHQVVQPCAGHVSLVNIGCEETHIRGVQAQSVMDLPMLPDLAIGTV